MNIAVIGTGYVGLVTGGCLAQLGMNVICMDMDEDKIKKLRNGIVPIYEPGLEEIIRENYTSKRLSFTTSIKEAVEHAKVIFIAVGTPPQEDDSADLKYVYQAARDIASHMEDYKVIVNKSTVPVGTGHCVKKEIENILQKRSKAFDFDVVSNPEFLREGTAVEDFMKPDRIVIGAESETALNLMKRIYDMQIQLEIPIVVTNLETAEMIKYASNAFLATKISYINEIADMCDLCNADIIVVSEAMGLDNRIGPKFLNPGPGYGGSCFPKDTKALMTIGKNLGYIPKLVKSTVEVNDNQPMIMVEKIINAIGSLENKIITILGIAFKPETDDIREAPSINIIKRLLAYGAKIKAFDPEAMENAKKTHPDLSIEYCSDIYSACENSDCIVLVTEWQDFTNLDFSQLKTIVRTPIFIDLRNAYVPSYVRSLGFLYKGVGRK
ncbi:MAG TPA: UDP-glucose/GDP-mannose dehydrogenase family protein [Patescibacteria group bacterium]|nr:UDP-glucose/GDP-mannose dehydrogenase family protein [Patescibacteria group bacterium]